MAHTDENYHVFGQHADDAIVLFPRVVRYHDDRCCWQRDRRRRCSCSRSEWPTSCTSRGGGRWSPSCCDANRRCWPGSSIPAFCVSSTRSRRVSKYNSKHFLCFFVCFLTQCPPCTRRHHSLTGETAVVFGSARDVCRVAQKVSHAELPINRIKSY